MHWRRFLDDPALRDFTAVERGPVRAMVRRGFEPYDELLGLGGAPGEMAGEVARGRAAHPVARLPGGERVVVRGYRRGGLMARLNRERYFMGNRAFEELRVTEHARLRGVRVPEVIAATQRRGRLGYRATLATRWIEGAVPLVDWLGRAGAASGPVLRAAGREIGAMHAAGVVHPDLNLRNLVVVPGASGAGEQVYLLDFDRASLLPFPAPRAARARDLRRLARSARKLRAPVEEAGWDALREGYGPEWPLPGRFG